jgi:hypothetical protein
MRGHDALIAMRLRRQVPLAVQIDTDGEPNRLHACWHSLGVGMAHLHIGADEAVQPLDLRCVVGLLVIVHGLDAGRVSTVVDACEAAGASRVVGSVFQRRGEEWEHAQMFDTDGVMTWPK